MTEMMKRYEAETGNRASKLTNEASIVNYFGNMVQWLNLKYESLQAENAELKAQLTWRPVSEKPEKDCQCFVSLADGGMVIIGMWKSGDLCIEEKYKWLGVKSWLPIPPQGE
jgi:hypothetical protein